MPSRDTDHSQALAASIQQALSQGNALRIQGHNSKQALHSEPPPANVPILHPEPHRGITQYEPAELVISARAGTPLTAVEAALDAHGQQLAFEPPRLGKDPKRQGTLGGAIASGLSGPARINRGAARDFVLGLRMINGQGQILSFGGQVMKNVAGYDLSRLMTGSWGQLGLILDVSLKVLPKPESEQTQSFSLDQTQALKLLTKLAQQPLPISASAWHDGQLQLRLSGSEAAVQQACQQLGGEPHPEPETLWQSLRDHQHPLFQQPQKLWRISLPAASAPILSERPQLIEWQGQQRWILLDEDQPQQIKQLQQQTQALGGHAQRYHQQGQPDPGPINQALRQAFDPHQLFASGKL